MMLGSVKVAEKAPFGEKDVHFLIVICLFLVLVISRFGSHFTGSWLLLVPLLYTALAP